jgi:hypothetical protein
MGRLQSQIMPRSVESHIRDVIPHTEHVHAISDFLANAGMVGLKEAPCTLAITDSTLWVFYWNLSNRRRRWTRTDSIPFDVISTITTRLVSMPVRNFYQLSLRLTGGTDNIRNFKSLYVEGEPFIQRFQHLLANRRAGQSSAADELGELKTLAAEGVLSASEWERAKSLYLGKEPDARQEAVRLLRNLHDMHRNGILSESEFNIKKWDILTKL